MKEDYLWDRTGSDPGVEGLERKLGVFRLEGSAAPRIVLQRDTQQPGRSGLRLAFAGAALTSVVVASFLFFVSAGELYDIRSLSVSLKEQPPRMRPVAIPDAPEIVEPEAVASQIVGARTPKAGTKKAPVRREPAQPSIPSEDQFAMLTREEREAYDQLMLALSVTTSSLKLVQEKADGDLYSEPVSAGEAIQSRSN